MMEQNGGQHMNKKMKVVAITNEDMKLSEALRPLGRG